MGDSGYYLGRSLSLFSERLYYLKPTDCVEHEEKTNMKDGIGTSELRQGTPPSNSAS